MEKKIYVIGSIIAVFILILVSLSSVISAQTVRTLKVEDKESNKNSDLFINILQKEYKFRNVAYHLESGEFFFNLLVALIMVYLILIGWTAPL